MLLHHKGCIHHNFLYLWGPEGHAGFTSSTVFGLGFGECCPCSKSSRYSIKFCTCTYRIPETLALKSPNTAHGEWNQHSKPFRHGWSSDEPETDSTTSAARSFPKTTVDLISGFYVLPRVTKADCKRDMCLPRFSDHFLLLAHRST